MTKENNSKSPSPFQVVNEYENLFIKFWNKNTAEAVGEVLKYIAKSTASAIKKNEENKK